ncbi:hypothetical protein OROGR_025010 [Orobanche gracilis]
MGFSKTEVNLRRLLAAAPQQQNQAKLVHVSPKPLELALNFSHVTGHGYNNYASSSRSDDISRATEKTYNDNGFGISPYFSSFEGCDKKYVATLREQLEQLAEERGPEGLPRVSKAQLNEYSEKIEAIAAKLVAPEVKLQEDLTDEMVGLARQLKESSLMMNQSIKNTEKILDSTEKAVEHSLASTGRANTRAMEVYSQSMKTSCFTWLLIFVMTCIFVMVVLLIRVT